MAELVDYQVSSIEKVKQNAPIKRIIIEGDFAKNHLFIAMLANRLKGVTIIANRWGIGTALGTAIMLKPEWGSKKHLKRQMIVSSKQFGKSRS